MATTLVLVTTLAPRISHSADLLQVLLAPPLNYKEAHLNHLYEDVHGALVMDYDIGVTKNDRVYFSNEYGLINMSEVEARDLANIPFALARFASRHRLAPLQSVYSVIQVGSVSMQVIEFDAPKCQWPYSAVLRIKSRSDPAGTLMFFRKRKGLYKSSYQIWCERGPGKIEISTHYENLSAGLALSSSGEPFITIESPPTVFRLNLHGTMTVPRVSDDLIITTSSRSEQLLGMVAEGGMSPQQAVDKLESELDQIRLGQR